MQVDELVWSQHGPKLVTDRTKVETQPSYAMLAMHEERLIGLGSCVCGEDRLSVWSDLLRFGRSRVSSLGSIHFVTNDPTLAALCVSSLYSGESTSMPKLYKYGKHGAIAQMLHGPTCGSPRHIVKAQSKVGLSQASDLKIAGPCRRGSVDIRAQQSWAQYSTCTVA